MQNALNVCMFAGRVAKDPEVTTVNGGPNGSFDKARFSIAVDRALTSQQRQEAKNGSNIKTCDFVEVEAVGNVVTQLIKPYIVKGKSVVVTTHYEQFEWQDKNSGEKKYGHRFIIDNISFGPQDAKGLSENNSGNSNNGNGGYNNGGYNNNNYGNNNYGNNNRQQTPPQNNGFAMFDDSDQPF